MKSLKALALLSAFGAACFSFGQFSGPAPLAWRWSQFQLSSNTPLNTLGRGIVIGAPAADDEAIYVASGQRMYGLGRADGNQIWRFPPQDPLTKDAFKWQPILAGDTVIARTVANRLYAVDRHTGRALWTYKSVQKGITGDMVVAGDVLIFVDTANQLHAVKLDTGLDAWSSPLPITEGLTGSVTAKDGNIYLFTQTGELRCYNVASKKLEWSKSFTTIPSDAKAVVFGDYLYCISSTYVVCVSARNGNARWQRDIDAPLALYPAVSAEGVLVVDSLGKAFLLDPSNGRVTLREPVDFGGQLQVAPSAVGKLFVASTAAGDIVLMNPKTGTLSWRYRMKPTQANQTTNNQNNNSNNPNGRRTNATNLLAGVGSSGSPVSVGNSLVVMAQDASVFCFDAQNGVDVTPPEVKLAFPNPGESVNGQPPLALYFAIEDLSSGFDPDAVQFYVDGKLLEKSSVPSDVPIEGSVHGAAEVTREGFYVLRVSEAGSLKPLADGRHVFTVKARDWLGNVGSQDFILNIDNQLPAVRFSNQTNPRNGNNGNGGNGGDGGTRGGGGGGRGG